MEAMFTQTLTMITVLHINIFLLLISNIHIACQLKRGRVRTHPRTNIKHYIMKYPYGLHIIIRYIVDGGCNIINLAYKVVNVGAYALKSINILSHPLRLFSIL